ALTCMVCQRELYSRLQAGFGALQLQAAFQPEKFLEDQTVLRRRTECVEHAQIGIRWRKMQLADGVPTVGQFQLRANVVRQRIVTQRRDVFQDSMEQRT